MVTITFRIVVPEDGEDPTSGEVQGEVRQVEVYAPSREAAEYTLFHKYPTAVIIGYRVTEESEPDYQEDEDEEDENEGGGNASE